jgi:hypothetical protein
MSGASAIFPGPTDEHLELELEVAFNLEHVRARAPEPEPEPEPERCVIPGSATGPVLLKIRAAGGRIHIDDLHAATKAEYGGPTELGYYARTILFAQMQNRGLIRLNEADAHIELTMGGRYAAFLETLPEAER